MCAMCLEVKFGRGGEDDERCLLERGDNCYVIDVGDSSPTNSHVLLTLLVGHLPNLDVARFSVYGKLLLSQAVNGFVEYVCGEGDKNCRVDDESLNHDEDLEGFPEFASAVEC